MPKKNRNQNIISRKRIKEALPTMPDTFTSRDLATAAKLNPRKVAGLLKSMKGIEKIPVERTEYVRCMWRVVAI